MDGQVLEGKGRVVSRDGNAPLNMLDLWEMALDHLPLGAFSREANPRLPENYPGHLYHFNVAATDKGEPQAFTRTTPPPSKARPAASDPEP